MDRRTATAGSGYLRDRGSSTLELVIIFPIVLTLISAFVQGGVYWHASNVAQAAAREGVTVAQTETGTAAIAEQRARDLATSAGGGMLRDLQVTAARSAVEVRVVVQGRSPSIIPGVEGWTVRRTATGPVERYVSP